MNTEPKEITVTNYLTPLTVEEMAQKNDRGEPTNHIRFINKCGACHATWDGGQYCKGCGATLFPF